MGFYNTVWTPGPLDYFAWQGNITSVAAGLQKPVNERLTLKLATLGDKNYPGTLGEIAAATGNVLAHLDWALLHDKDKDEYEHWLPEMLNLLCLMSCEGPCKKAYDGDVVPDWPDFVCNNSLDNPNNEGDENGYNPWCTSDLWESVGALSTRCGNRPWASKNPGVDYMLAHNVYHLLAQDRPFFNPLSGEYNSVNTPTQKGLNRGDLEGEYFLCEGEVYEYKLSEELEYESIEWEISENLSFENSSPNDNIIYVRGVEQGAGYVRAVTNRGTGVEEGELDIKCNYNLYEVPIWVGLPDSPVLELPNCFSPRTNHTLKVISNGGADYTWRLPECSTSNPLPGPDPTNECWYNYDGNGPRPDRSARIFVGENCTGNISIWVSNPCGVVSRNFSVNCCNNNGGPGGGPRGGIIMRSFPNPTSGITVIEFSETLGVSLSSPADLNIVNPITSRVMYSDKVNDFLEKKTINTTNWEEGIYQVILQLGPNDTYIENLIVNRGK